jgi:putative addiction module component (TIGR02574 family)
MYTPTKKAMTPEVKYRLIERLIQTEDDDLLKQVEAILVQGTELSEEHKQILDERLLAHSLNPSAGSSWEQVKKRL